MFTCHTWTIQQKWSLFIHILCGLLIHKYIHTFKKFKLSITSSTLMMMNWNAPGQEHFYTLNVLPIMLYYLWLLKLSAKFSIPSSVWLKCELGLTQLELLAICNGSNTGQENVQHHPVFYYYDYLLKLFWK